MSFRLVDIQIQDANSGYLQTVFGGDFAEQGISRIVSDHKRLHPHCRVRAVVRVTEALIDFQ